MIDPVKRSYNSAGRRKQAMFTRRRIIAVASELFCDDGYSATSIAAIARAAEVAPQTVYAAFGSKSALLSEAIGVAMAGDDEPIAVIDRPDARAALTATDPDDAAKAFATAATRLLERAGHLLHAAEAAATSDPDLGRLRIAGHQSRMKDMTRTAEAFADNGLLRDGIDVKLAAELLWVLASPDTFRSFTTIHGWTSRRYEHWLTTALLTTILRSQPAPRDR